MTTSTFNDAEGYELLMGRWSRRLGPEFVAFAQIEDGARVLDVGCGTGSLTASILAARPRAEVVGIDPSPTFVDAARKRVTDPRARFEVGDAQSLSLPDGAFDTAASMLVLNFIPDSARAAAELRRVTRAGGAVSACVWDYAATAVLRHFWDAAASLNPEVTKRHERNMPLTRAGELEALWKATGFRDVRETTLAIDMTFASFADYWQPFLAGVGPSGAYATSLSEHDRSALEALLRKQAWNDEPDRPQTFPARAVAVRGVVPER